MYVCMHVMMHGVSEDLGKTTNGTTMLYMYDPMHALFKALDRRPENLNFNHIYY
jgi:hypothetical protein